MRTIKFRGKRVDNGEWVEGFVYEHQPPLVVIVPKDYIPEKSKWYIANTAFADWNMPRQVEFIEVNPSTVGQFTSLCDKNDKEIYEGDICDDARGFRFVVIWEDNARFLGCGIGKQKEYIRYVGQEPAVEVIGNIHDNPELLGVE